MLADSEPEMTEIGLSGKNSQLAKKDSEFPFVWKAEPRWIEAESTRHDLMLAICLLVDHAREMFVRHLKMEGVWLVRRADILFVAKPDFPGADFAVRSFITSAGRSSAEFEHELAQDGRVFARCKGVLVFTDRSRKLLKAAEDKKELLAKYTRPTRMDSFSSVWSQRPAQAHLTEFLIRPSDCDSNWHVFNARYVKILSDVRLLTYLALFKQGRIDERTFEASQMPTVRVFILFDREIKPGSVSVYTWPLELRAAKAADSERGGCFAFEFVRDGAVLCRAKVLTSGAEFEMKSNL